MYSFFDIFQSMSVDASELNIKDKFTLTGYIGYSKISTLEYQFVSPLIDFGLSCWQSCLSIF
jgi:hypothetical protein